MRKRTVAFFMAIAFTLCCTYVTYAAKSVSQLKDELSENQKKVEETKKEIKEKQTEQNKQKAKKDEIDLEIALLQNDIDSIQRVIEEKDAEIARMDEEIIVIEASIEETYELLKKRIKAMYEGGTTSYLEILLSSNGLSDLYTRMSAIETIADHDQKMIDDYGKQIETLNQTKLTLEQEKNEQIEVKAMYEEKKAEIKKKQDEQQAIINELSKDINELKRQEKEMEEAERQIQAQIEAALRSSEQQAVTYSGSGKFILPLASYTRISDPYGLREKHPITGKRTMHNGIDYAAPAGTAIYAADDGVVLTSGWINGYGYTITINHGNGIVTLYAHCSSLIAKSGQKVKQGETIARVGTTGNSTGNHLHFEVKVNGKAQNPANYF